MKNRYARADAIIDARQKARDKEQRNLDRFVIGVVVVVSVVVFSILVTFVVLTRY